MEVVGVGSCGSWGCGWDVEDVLIRGRWVGGSGGY